MPLIVQQLAMRANLNRYAVAACATLGLLVTSGISRADSLDSAARFTSNTGTALFLAAGTLLPLVEDGDQGKQETLRIVDSGLTSVAITEGLKHIVREKRPNSDERNSFPSGHATVAFAVAAMQAHYHPDQQWLWYGGATLIAASRVQLRAHHTHDVVAGAAVGYFVSQWELRNKHGLLLFPIIDDHGNGGKRYGMAVRAEF
jgi:hypothetical protein